jgi:hypothetical protein
VCLAIPGKIVELDALNPQLAVVDVVGVRRKVDLGLLQDDLPVPGDWVLIRYDLSRYLARAKPPCKRCRATGLRTRGQAGKDWNIDHEIRRRIPRARVDW